MPAFWRVHWLQVVGLFGVSGPAKRLALVLWSCVPSFCPLSRFVFGVSRANMVLFRVLRAFLARFGVVVWVCVACVLCVACVALYACGVRRIKGLWRVCLYFSSSLPSFSSLYLLFVLHLVSFVLVVFCLSFCLVLFVFVVFVVVSFSLSDYTQKERARRVGASSPRVLWVCLYV